MGKPPLIPWASRGAGMLAVVGAVIHFLINVGAVGVVAAGLSGLLIAGAGILAYRADRMPVPNGRRVMWLSFGFLFVAGVLTIFGAGLLLLIGCMLAIFSLSRTRPGRGTAPDR